MAQPTGGHEVRNPVSAQTPPAYPIEHFFDLNTGQRLRRECLGVVQGGQLIIGQFARSTGLDLYFKRLMGNPRQPQPGELDASLRRFIEQCWSTHLRRPGKPKVQKYGGLIWLTTMPLADYAIGPGVDGGSALYRFRPLIQRPRAALAVPLANGIRVHGSYRLKPRRLQDNLNSENGPPMRTKPGADITITSVARHLTDRH